jgi:hypothetical protein
MSPYTSRLRRCRQRRSAGARAGRWPLWSLLVVVAACGDGSSTTDDPPDPTLAYVVASCRDDAEGLVFGPERLEIRRGDREPVIVMEVPASTPFQVRGLCRSHARHRALPGELSDSVAFTRLAVSPDGSAVIFEVTDEFTSYKRTLSAEQKGIFVVDADGKNLRRFGPPSRVYGGGNFQGFRFSPDGRNVIFNDTGPDHAGHEASQVVLLDIATGDRGQVTHLSPSPSEPLGRIFSPRFVDSETIAFGTTLNADGVHPMGGVFTVSITGGELTAIPAPAVLPGSRIDPTFVITGDQPHALEIFLDGKPVDPCAGTNDFREVFLADGANLLQLTNFRRADTAHVLLSVDRQRVFFIASADPLGTNSAEDLQLFSADVLGTEFRQLTHFRETGTSSNRCFLGCALSRLFQDPVTETVAFISSCNPLGSNPYGVQIFSVRPDGTDLRQLTNLPEIMPNTTGPFTAELIGLFAYPGVGSANQE